MKTRTRRVVPAAKTLVDPATVTRARDLVATLDREMRAAADFKAALRHEARRAQRRAQVEALGPAAFERLQADRTARRQALHAAGFSPSARDSGLLPLSPPSAEDRLRPLDTRELGVWTAVRDAWKANRFGDLHLPSDYAKAWADAEAGTGGGGGSSAEDDPSGETTDAGATDDAHPWVACNAPFDLWHEYSETSADPGGSVEASGVHDMATGEIGANVSARYDPNEDAQLYAKAANSIGCWHTMAETGPLEVEVDLQSLESWYKFTTFAIDWLWQGEDVTASCETHLYVKVYAPTVSGESTDPVLQRSTTALSHTDFGDQFSAGTRRTSRFITDRSYAAGSTVWLAVGAAATIQADLDDVSFDSELRYRWFVEEIRARTHLGR